VRILELLAAGASRRAAAAGAGVDHSTLGRWLARGETASPEGRWAEFLRDVRAAEAEPKIRALRTLSDGLVGSPEVAWRFLEREEFAKPGTEPEPEPSDGPIIIQLRFDGPRLLPPVDDDEPDDA
jgi:hypothetical protein